MFWYGISKTEIPTTENRFKNYREAIFLDGGLTIKIIMVKTAINIVGNRIIQE